MSPRISCPVVVRAARSDRRTWVAGGLAVLWLFALVGAASAAEPVYRCTDEAGHVTYTSFRCKDGVELNIDAGNANPAAIERLHRDVELDRQQESARQFQRAQEAAYRASLDFERRQSQDARYSGPPDVLYANGYCDYCGMWSFVPYYPPHKPRPPRIRVRPSFVPAPGVVATPSFVHR